jgi:hypothetical protein
VSIITIQFSSSTAWASAIIRKVSHSPFSHVDAVIADGQSLLGSSDMGPNSPCITGNPQGVAVRPHNYQEFDIQRNARLEISDDGKTKFYDALYSRLGKPFDCEALLSFLDDGIDHDWQQDDKWFCSELIAWALQTAGYWNGPLRVPMSRITPHDLLMTLSQDKNFTNSETFRDMTYV